MSIVYFIIALMASITGTVSGTGGGIMIKPLMDAVSGLDAETVNFLSGCTVFTMATTSYIRTKKNDVIINYSITATLAFGAVFGGIAGKTLLALLADGTARIQSILLLIINICIFFYIQHKHKITKPDIHSKSLSLPIGFLLGILSAFLGIGGGFLNIAVLSFFFSMQPKAIVKNSLIIILFSQTASLLTAVLTRAVPVYRLSDLLFMCIGGAAGALIGSHLSVKMSETRVEKFSASVLVLLICLNVYNIII